MIWTPIYCIIITGFHILVIVVIQLLSHVQHFATPWTVAHQTSLTSLSPRVCSNSCPLSQWCYLTISSSVTLFFFCLWSFPASGSFPMSWNIDHSMRWNIDQSPKGNSLRKYNSAFNYKSNLMQMIWVTQTARLLWN